MTAPQVSPDVQALILSVLRDHPEWPAATAHEALKSMSHTHVTVEEIGQVLAECDRWEP